MEIRQLRYLVAIADEGQFTKAAAREHVAQPALSQQIRRLEDEVGSPLLVRAPRHSTLTPAGEILVERSRRILAELDAAQADLADLAGLRGGSVSIGAMRTLGPFDLTALLIDFHNRHPEVDLIVREEVSTRLAELLQNDQLDLVLLSLTNRVGTDGLEQLRVGTERLAAALPPDHPLLERERISMADLRDEPFISFSEGATLREILFDASIDAGFRPSISVESNEVPRIRAMVSRGMGVALLPLTDLERPGPPVEIRSLGDPPIERDVTLAWRSQRWLPPAAQTLLDLARARVEG